MKSAGSSATRSRPTGRRTSRCPTRRVCSASSGWSSVSARESTPKGLAELADEVTRSCWPWAWARTSTCPTRTTSLEGVWESLPFIEQLKTGDLPDVGERVVVIGGGNTAVDVAVEASASARTCHPALPADRARDARLRARGRAARREGVEIRFLADPVGFVGTDRVEGIRARDAARPAGRERRRRPEPVPGSEFVIAADTAVKAIGQQPRRRVPLAARVASTRTAGPRTRDLCRRRRRQRRRERGRGGSRGEARGARIDEWLRCTRLTEIRWHARAGQGAKTAAQILALALLRSGKGVQAFPEYGPERRGAPLRAYTRVEDRPIRRHDSDQRPRCGRRARALARARGGRRRRAAAGRGACSSTSRSRQTSSRASTSLRSRCRLASTARLRLRQPRHARRCRGGARRAAARRPAGRSSGDARPQGGRRRPLPRALGGIRWAS